MRVFLIILRVCSGMYRRRCSAHPIRRRFESRSQPGTVVNAFKHGIFARNPTIDGEDPEEFELLYASPVEEWSPNGSTEEDTVFRIAKAV